MSCSAMGAGGHLAVVLLVAATPFWGIPYLIYKGGKVIVDKVKRSLNGTEDETLDIVIEK